MPTRSHWRRAAGISTLALLAIVGLLSLSACGGSGSAPETTSGVPGVLQSDTLTPLAVIGKQVFEDTSLSEPAGQGCITCHQRDKGLATNNVVETGVVAGHFGTRNTPSLGYLRFSPDFSLGSDGPVGGFFRDGRAATFTAQAEQPFLNPDEMANPDIAHVIAKIAVAPYAAQFKAIWGDHVFDDQTLAFDRLGMALAAYQREDNDFAPFTSRFDLWRQGKVQFTANEQRGFALFNDPLKGNCAACHPSTGPDPKTPPLFTDFSFDNLGLPRNMLIPANADPDYFDLGICGPERTDIKDQSLCGQFKVPTLRNIALTAPYFHNGVITTLRETVRFYVTRDTNPELWYPTVDGVVQKFNDLPQRYHGNVNTLEVPYNRHPGEAPALDDEEIDRVVDFLNTLTDGYQP